jgi:hypothetical protein
MALLCHCHSSYFATTLGGQVQIAGLQTGIGLLTVADWWLAMPWVVEEDTEAAAAPTKTMDKAMTRMASFIFSNLFSSLVGLKRNSDHNIDRQ